MKTLLRYAALIGAAVFLSACSGLNQAPVTGAAPSYLAEYEIALQVEAKRPDQSRITVLPIGAGNCILLELPAKDDGVTPILINDCGSSGQGENGWSKQSAVDYIHHIYDLYDKPVVFAVVSHADIDHYNILPLLPSDLVTNAVLGGRVEDYSDDMRQWLDGIKQHHGQDSVMANLLKTYSGNLLEYTNGVNGNSVYFEVITANAAPLPDVEEDKNSDSIVTRYESDDFSVLLTGDATANSILSALNNSAEGLESNILIAPHHGASTAGSNSVLIGKAILPEAVIFSSGDRYYHPKCSALDAYKPSDEVLQTIANYQPRIRTTWDRHTVRCGADRQYKYYDTSLSFWVTATNGLFTHAWPE
ncbi:hypothetical protein GCM10011352_17500 [Marinobacterium zhoushanense]|uniref:Beta-lactamase superfamily II metal-dependent hydrolase n=1 Tax=Marinobacterium zhoushanense TaxID=1679163 RepID=A0ABQ1KEL7_9GAMM|nr:hypothetical protein [Marinobacterium zhoushanense]GGB91936.1 hypothetical protein GCM10011352_17500 [Marinobacterium zhoushanense]